MFSEFMCLRIHPYVPSSAKKATEEFEKLTLHDLLPGAQKMSSSVWRCILTEITGLVGKRSPDSNSRPRRNDPLN